MALWNFAQGDARDATGHGFDGVLRQGARCPTAQLPTQVVSPSVLCGRVFGAAGEALAGAALQLEEDDALVVESGTHSAGFYRLVVLPQAGKKYDLGATWGESGNWHIDPNCWSRRPTACSIVLAVNERLAWAQGLSFLQGILRGLDAHY